MSLPPRSAFTRFTSATAHLAGRPVAFFVAVAVVAAWAITGPLFEFSNTWQLVINTGTTIATFLMVFLIQSTQNRDAAAVQIKLDELIRAVHGAKDTLIDLEDLDEAELERVRAEYAALAARARAGRVETPRSRRVRRPRRGRAAP
jgi:low affinity Fe/Cu permease